MSTASLETMAGRIKPGSASDALLWAILTFFALFVVWATLTELDRTVHADGRVVPTARLQIVSNLEGGIVREILVRSGIVVRAGAPLVRLDTTATGSDFNANQSAYDSLMVRVARLEAELAGRRPQFPVTNDSAAAEQVVIEQSLYLSRQLDLSSLLSAGNARVIQAERAVAEADANVAAAVAARDGAKQQAELLRPLVASGIEPRMSLMQADRQASVAASQTLQARAAVSRAQSGVAEARATLSQVRQEWRARAAQELATTQAEIASKRQALPALQDRVARTIVRAPLTGRINRVMPSTVGGTVRPGEPLVEIVPLERGLTIEARVRPSDIAFVRQGQRALIKITAYDYSIYGGLEGKVVGISPDAIQDERTDEQYYQVRILTQSEALLDKSGGKLPIGPGMVADASLIGDKRSVMSYLLTPFTKLSENAFTER